MNLLIYTPAFYPHIGGLEAFNRMLAEEFTKYGFKVVVITPMQNPTGDDSIFPFTVVRDTSFKTIWKYYKWCDLFIHSVLSLKAVWPLFLFPKKWISIHHTCYFHLWDGKDTLISKFKWLFSNFSENIVVSNAVGQNLGLHKYTVIRNAYDNQLFRCINYDGREGFVFVGRLVSEKGVLLLLEAYNKYLEFSKRKWRLSIIGDGQDKEYLQDFIHRHNLVQYVSFVGSLTGEALVQELNEYHSMIIPSIYKEACGIVALEGIACGCFCIGSDGDGIQEAMGDTGILFKKGSAADLTKKMLWIENHPFAIKDNLNSINKHLECHTKGYVAQQYINYIERMINAK